MDRRTFLRQNSILGASLYGAHLANAARQDNSATRPPNVIFVTVDQQCADELGCMGNPEVKTPHLDQLAKDGVLLTNMFTQAVTCGPSRTAMITGKYCHATGVQTNAAVLPAHEITLAGLFRSRGYRCAAIGKVENPQGLKSGPIDVDEGFVQGFHELHSLERPSDPKVADVGLNGYISTYLDDIEDHWDTKTLRNAQRLLKKHRKDPVFMWLAFHQPHHPICPPKKFMEMYNPADLALPPSAAMDVVNRPKSVLEYTVGRIPNRITREDTRLLRAHRYAAASFMDDCMGQLVDTIRELGQEQDTILVYMSDGGSYAGHFGWHRKLPFMLYDCLLHVPALMWAPGRIGPAKPVDAFAEETDVAPTLLEMADIEIPWCIQGKSLLPLVRGEVRDLHNAVFAETGFDDRCVMARTTEWKFVYHYNDQHELYNLKTDPYETRNVYGEHPAVEARLRDRLLKWRMDMGSPLLKDHKRGRV